MAGSGSRGGGGRGGKGKGKKAGVKDEKQQQEEVVTAAAGGVGGGEEQQQQQQVGKEQYQSMWGVGEEVSMWEWLVLVMFLGDADGKAGLVLDEVMVEGGEQLMR
jgi:hypothetical protein